MSEQPLSRLHTEFNANAPLPGKVIAGRYEILQLLGEGRMGAVYTAQDRELGRVVALKVIHPELAERPEIFQRFKEELIQARQLNHRNVIRIFDLNEAGRMKFITMEYVESENLRQILQAKSKLETGEALSIIGQVCLALDAAHAEGVVHRDLKPQNILVGKQGRVWVTDFAIAGSLQEAGQTWTGGLAGSTEYMSPEQVLEEKLDARSDLFALGLILYELLTGLPPSRRDTAARKIPQPLGNVVTGCLATDRDQRYQTAMELFQELEVLAPGSSTFAASHRQVESDRRKYHWKWIVASAALMAIAVGGFFLRERLLPEPASKQKAMTVLVSDFTNTTGESVFDGTLESALTIAVEGASFITAYNRGRARQLGVQLQPGTTKLDDALARLVAVREGITVVLGGSISRQGNAYAVSLQANDAVTGKLIVARQTKAATKEAVLNTVGRVAVSIRQALGDATPESVQLAAAETYTSSSLDVAHIYAQAMESQWAGNWNDTIKYFLEAVKLDPNFGRAYAGLAVAYQNLKQRDKAEENFKKALALLDRMSPREKYRTLGVYYLIFVRNYPLAIETLRQLVEQFPADSSGYNNLSIAYVYTRNIPEALKASRHALENNAENLQHRLNLCQYSMYASEYETAIAECGRILKSNPGFEFAYVPVALSKLAQGDVAGSRETYARQEKVNPLGYSFAKTGEGDLEMYMGRYKEAMGPLQQGIEADEKEKSLGMMALKHIAKAEAHLAMGERAQAVEAVRKAYQLDPTEFVLYPSARVLIQAGEQGEARTLAKTLDEKLQIQTKSYARLIEGEIALQRQQIPEALEAFREGQKLLDSWIAHFLLGRAHLEAGQYADGLAELEICLKRRGEATDFLFADTSTLRYLPPLYYWLGRAQEGLGSKDAARASYQSFLKLRSQANPGDPLVDDARRRSGFF